MSLAELVGGLPTYAEDQRRNLEVLLTNKDLSDQQKWGCFLACALMLGEPSVIRAFEHETDGRLSDGAKSAARSVVALMAMNTTYYRAVNLLDHREYRAPPIGLSMDALSHPAIEKIDFELWSFALAAIAGCGACLNAHETQLHNHGVDVDTILAALRIAAVMQSVSVVVRGERKQ